ncbi:ParB/RepB/Spo0J family partition protein [Streptoalloteichus hindustanus]|uniref:ParB/RepB/Spo0J family partition protein n=1 Tax=Streptoalloteichus hindustanus TaxID=2017 RepID=UPI001F15D556|nr:ParB N-terminal domain-containing protein [Streptoalloteichus hindustanus]
MDRDGTEDPVTPDRELGANPAVLVSTNVIRGSDSPRRGGENAAHVRALAEAGTPLPPIVVHRRTMRVVDGMHRLLAARSRGEEQIEVIFFDGDAEEAFVLAVRLNARHGLPLSRADRIAAVVRIARSHPHWSNRAIAAVAGLSDKTVAAIRRSSPAAAPTSARTGRDGRVRPSNGAEGRRRASALIAAKPHASLREIAHEAGIAPATVRDVRDRLRRGEDPIPPRQQQSGADRRAENAIPARRSPINPPSNDRQPERAVPTVASEPPGATDLSLAMRVLKNDPSLRFSEAGRRMLRLLDAHSIAMDDWSQFASAVPAHCAPTVAQAAQQCAEAWRQFAEHLADLSCAAE